ncbi:MAG: thioredoxin domain-containing protein [Desulfofustis sp.]|nr:thioredoxin domain-containing protein [Desulfofustis sp.]
MTGRIERLKQEFDIGVEWKAFPLHPNTPAEGLALEELFNAPSEKITKMVSGLKQTAASLGLPFGDRTKTYNSRLAQELGLWAEDQNKGDQFHQATFESYFVDGENLADHHVLLRLAAKVGLLEKEANVVLQTRSYADDVDAHWQEARQLGITAVPTFLMGFNRVVGAQSYDALTDLVTMAGAARND